MKQLKFGLILLQNAFLMMEFAQKQKKIVENLLTAMLVIIINQMMIIKNVYLSKINAKSNIKHVKFIIIWSQKQKMNVKI